MAIRSFQQYIRENRSVGKSLLRKPSVSKTVQVLDDGVEIIINISLSRYEQHTEVINFLMRLADELSAFEEGWSKTDR